MGFEDDLTMSCLYEESIVEDNEFMTEAYKPARSIPCFKYGDKINLIASDTIDKLSAQTYLVSENVKAGDKIDGQLVRLVNEIPDFDGSIPLREVHVAETV